MPENKRLQNYLHLHFIVFIWGFTAVIGKLITIDAIPLVWWRMSLAFVFVLLYFLVTKKRYKITKKQALQYFAGGLIIAVHWITFFMAIKVSNVSITLIMMSTGAFFTALIEPLFFKRKIDFLEILFGCIAFFGIYLIYNVQGDYFFGIVLALISAFLSALFSVINGKLVQQQEASVISLYQILFGALCITAYLVFSGGFSASFFAISLEDLMYLLILSSICTAYAFMASVHVMKYLRPFTVMLTINLEPVYGILLALVVFGTSEAMNTQFYLGASIIFAVVLINGIVKNQLQKSKNKHI